MCGSRTRVSSATTARTEVSVGKLRARDWGGAYAIAGVGGGGLTVMLSVLMGVAGV